ncbi:MAG TPA: hypothetical protein VMY80_17260 [Anaerolineae bacterium]|nr:hypothetical protein [Anaerolineae bacterium]
MKRWAEAFDADDAEKALRQAQYVIRQVVEILGELAEGGSAV